MRTLERGTKRCVGSLEKEERERRKLKEFYGEYEQVHEICLVFPGLKPGMT